MADDSPIDYDSQDWSDGYDVGYGQGLAGAARSLNDPNGSANFAQGFFDGWDDGHAEFAAGGNAQTVATGSTQSGDAALVTSLQAAKGLVQVLDEAGKVLGFGRPVDTMPSTVVQHSPPAASSSTIGLAVVALVGIGLAVAMSKKAKKQSVAA